MNAADNTQHQQTGIEAAYQVEAMLRTLLAAAHHGNTDNLPSLLKGMVPRLLELNGVSMSCHDADSDSVEDLRELLHGGYDRLVDSSKGGAA
jgi:hypothetical protein